MPFLSTIGGGSARGFGRGRKGGGGSSVIFKLWGAGGGSGSQNRSGNGYHTSTYYGCKCGGAGSFVTAEFQVTPGTNQ